MLMVISPAKSLDFETPVAISKNTMPDFLERSQMLVNIMKGYSPLQLSELMKLSDKLAQLNVARFGQWQQPFTLDNAKQAIYAFTGDVYLGLDVNSLNKKAVNYLQQHLSILSGLYGLLRPLDLMQPYRLEMGTKLINPEGKDLYQFWKPVLTSKINQLLEQQTEPTLVNLASNEYFKAIDKKALNGAIVTPVFKDWKNGQYKMISFFAKKARGLMVRFAAENQIKKAQDLKQFDLAGYGFDNKLSTELEWVFTRKQV